MPLQPTNTTAALAGVWAMVGLASFEAWLEGQGFAAAGAGSALWLLAVAVFFFVPVYFLVLGRQEPFGRAWFLDREERARYGVVARRIAAWFLSAGATGAVWTLVGALL